jgi:hypothetical protein
MDESVPDRTRRQGRCQLGEVVVHKPLHAETRLDIEEGIARTHTDYTIISISGSKGAKCPTAPAKQKRQQKSGEEVLEERDGTLGSDFFSFLGKWLFFNTQLDIQSMLLLIWMRAYQEIGHVHLGLLLLPPVLVLSVTAAVLWCRLLQTVLGCRSIWMQKGADETNPSRASVWSLRTRMSTGKCRLGLKILQPCTEAASSALLLGFVAVHEESNVKQLPSYTHPMYGDGACIHQLHFTLK